MLASGSKKDKSGEKDLPSSWIKEVVGTSFHKTIYIYIYVIPSKAKRAPFLF